MSISFNEVKLNLVNFFIKTQGYKSSTKDNEYISYLYNLKKDNKIIRISIGEPLEEDKTLEEVKNQLKSGSRELISVLTIVLGQKTNGKADSSYIYIVDPEAYVSALKDKFPKIVNLKIEKKENEDIQMTDEEIIESLQDPENSKDPEFKNLAKKIKTSTPILAPIFAFMFAILPIVIIFLPMFGIASANLNLNGLVFGGLDHNLTILGGQWWRVFTWGMSYGTASVNQFMLIFFLFVNLLILYKITLYAENIIKRWKLFLTVLAAYLITGFFMASITLDSVLAGYPAVLAAVISSVGVSAMNKKNTLSVISKSKIIVPIAWLFFSAILMSNMTVLGIVIIALAISMGSSFLLEYNFSKTSGFLIVPVLFVLTPLVTAIISLFISQYYQAIDTNTLRTLLMYEKWNLISQSTIEKTFEALNWNIVVGEGQNGLELIILG